MRHFIRIDDLSAEQLLALIDRTIEEKALYRPDPGPASLERKTLAMLFEKASLRTRVSFEVAMNQLGGTATYLDQTAIGIGSREAIKDIARVLGRMCDGIMARTFSHQLVEELARYSPVPVINGLTDFCHPCQAMADLVTLRECFGELEGKTLAFVGDGNNVARSLATACAKLGIRFVLTSPPEYELPEAFFEQLLADHPGADSAVIRTPGQAVADADVIYTDTWVSMGQEAEREKRAVVFRGYQVNAELMSLAPKKAIVLHCLPAYRDMEITDAIFEANAEHILNQSENRLHFQRTLLKALLAEGGLK